MAREPYKTYGIYYRKMNPKTELENYDTSIVAKMGRLFGSKTESYYQVVRFATKYEFGSNYEITKEYTVAVVNFHYGNIEKLAKWLKQKDGNDTEMYNLKCTELTATFENDLTNFVCQFNDNGLTLETIPKSTGKSKGKEYYKFLR